MPTSRLVFCHLRETPKASYVLRIGTPRITKQSYGKANIDHRIDDPYLGNYTCYIYVNDPEAQSIESWGKRQGDSLTEAIQHFPAKGRNLLADVREAKELE